MTASKLNPSMKLNVFAAALLLCYHANTLAEDDILGSISLEDLLDIEVVTASRSKESASQAPGTVVVIPRQQIHDRGYRFLEDVLKDLPGVENQKASDPVPYNRISIRGVQGNSKFVILQNGIRISSPTGEEIPISTNFPLYHVKQIEIVFGPASALYGADAFTGVINLITYRESEQLNSSMNTQVGSNSYGYADFVTGFKWGEHTDIVIGAHINKDDHIDYAAEYPSKYPINDLKDFSGNVIVPAAQRNRPQFSTKSNSLYVSLRANENFTLGFNYSSFENNTALSTRPDAIDFQTSSVWRTELSTLYGNYSFEISELISSDIQASYSVYEVDPKTRFRNIFVGYRDGFKYAKGTEAEFGQQFHINLSENSEVIAGYVFERFTSIPKTADLPKAFNTHLATADQKMYYIGTNGALPLQIFEVNYDSFGAFAQLKHKWSESITGVAGVRYDKSSSYGSTVNPRAGLVWLPQDKLTVKLLFGEAFLAPSPKSAYENFGSFIAEPDENGVYQSGFFHVPNPQLQPEEMQTLELNVNYRVADNLNLTMTIYSEQVDNLIMKAPVTPAQSDFVPGGFIAATQSNQNIGELKAHGVDLGFIYQSNLAKGTLQLFGNASYVDGELTSQGMVTDLPFSAKYKIKVGASYRRENVYVTPSFYHFSETHGSEIGADVGHTVPGYSTFNLVAGYENLVANLDLNVRIENLTNRKYFNAGLGDFDFLAVPQETRRYSVGLDYRF